MMPKRRFFFSNCHYKIFTKETALCSACFCCSSVPTKPIITRAAVNAAELEQLIEEFSVFKSDTASELMRRNYVRRQQEQRRKMLAKLEDNSLQTDSQVRCLHLLRLLSASRFSD